MLLVCSVSLFVMRHCHESLCQLPLGYFRSNDCISSNLSASKAHSELDVQGKSCLAGAVCPEQHCCRVLGILLCAGACSCNHAFILLASVVFWQNCCNRRYPNAAGFAQERTLSCVLRLSACPAAIRLLAMNAWPLFGGEEMCHNLGYI